MLERAGSPDGDALVFVGQNPGWREDETGRPFVGSSGRVLRRLYIEPFLKAGLDLSIYLSNAARCFAKKVSESHVRTCAPLYLYPDLEQIFKNHRRVVIIACGASACHAISGHKLASLTAPITTVDKFLKAHPLNLTPPNRPDPIVAFGTLHPAALLHASKVRDAISPAKARVVIDHMRLVLRWLLDLTPTQSKPRYTRPFAPTSTTTRRIAVDIESYGKIMGRPHQTQFHPTLCQRIDGASLQDLALIASITLIENTSPDPPGEVPAASEVGRTMVLDLRRAGHRELLLAWLAHAEELWGMNFVYDMLMLRAQGLAWRNRLNGRQRIVDLGVLNYLESESRPERSLKDIGPILGLWDYEEGIRKKRLSFDAAMLYCGEDTHNTALGIIELRRRIRGTFGVDTPKLSEFAGQFYSDLAWTVVHLEEAGVPISRRRLGELDQLAERKEAAAVRIAALRGYPLAGEGSVKIRRDQYLQCAQECPEVCEPGLWSFLDSGEVSVKETNRRLLFSLLPKGHRYLTDLRVQEIHGFARTLTSRYTRKLRGFLHPVRVTGPVEAEPEVGVCYPSWFLTPGPFKDDKGSSGGTQQSRITCTNPPIQTNPPPVKRCIGSRYKGGAIVSFDLKQIEIRVAALLSHEPVLIEIYKDDAADIHTRTAKVLFGPDVVNEPTFHTGDGKVDKRQWAKIFNFARLYRAGAQKLREIVLKEAGLLLPWDVVQRETDRRSADWPVLWAWQQALLREADRRGYLQLPFIGQSRFLSSDADHNTILNFPVQTTAGSVMHRLKARIIPRLPDGCLFFADIYDAGYIDTPPGAAAAVEELVHESVRWCAESDYWGMLCRNENVHVPLCADVHVS